ncbi:MAG: SH3 domain-containing protein [Chloroflexi bacterium]|nr:SH3 domain-containing protein [Chloroflexota bacterium]
MLRHRLLVLGLVVFLLLPPLAAAHAQTGDDTLIEYNTPVIVNLTPGQSVLRTFVATRGDNFEIRLTPTSDYIYTALLIDPGQQTTPLALDPDGNVRFPVNDVPQSGSYTLVLQSSDASGELLIQVNSATPPPVALEVGETEVDLQGERLRFSLEPPALTGTMQLAIDVLPSTASIEPAALPALALIDAETGDEALSVRGGTLPGLSLLLPAQTAFVLMIEPAETPLQIVLDWSEAPPFDQPGGQIPTPTGPPAITVTPITTGPCQVTFTGGTNIRTGPSTIYPIIGSGNVGIVLNVTGRNADASWWQVAYNNQQAWVSNRIPQVVTQGDCSAIPLAAAPPPPTLTPTPLTTATPAVTSIATPTSDGTPTATSEFTPTPTGTATSEFTPTPTATATPEMTATLNFSLSPVYGSSAISSGFVPDPFTVGVTAGGPADVSYLGGGCTGYTSSAPSFSLNYTAGAFPLLRFYFIGGGDTSLIINTPGGSYFCVDDSFGTLNPTIDFNSPASGRYDVWVATFNSGGSIGGTLYVTENSANHP